MIYLVVFIISTLLIWIRDHIKFKFIKPILTIISAVLLILLLGLRYYVGTDYGSYVYIFNEISALGYNELFSFTDTEIGHTIICKLVYSLGLNYQAVFMIYAILTIYFLYRTMDRLKINKSLFLLTYLLMVFPYSFNIMRQSLAMVIILYSLTYLFDNNRFKSLFLLLVACLFHKPALIVLPIYLCHLFIKKRKYRNFILIITYSIIVGLFLTNALTIIDVDTLSRYSNYIISNNEYIMVFTNIVKISPIIIMFLLFYDDFKVNNINNYIYIDIFIISIIFTFLGALNGTLNRLSLYFSVFDSVLIGTFTNRKKILFIKLCLILYLVIYFLYQFYYSGIGEIFPYRGWISWI